MALYGSVPGGWYETDNFDIIARVFSAEETADCGYDDEMDLYRSGWVLAWHFSPVTHESPDLAHVALTRIKEHWEPITTESAARLLVGFGVDPAQVEVTERTRIRM